LHGNESCECVARTVIASKAKQSMVQRGSVVIPGPTFVTIAKRPSEWAGDNGNIGVICYSENQNIFLKRDWTGRIALIPFKKLDFSRNSERVAGLKQRAGGPKPGWSGDRDARRKGNSRGLFRKQRLDGNPSKSLTSYRMIRSTGWEPDHFQTLRPEHQAAGETPESPRSTLRRYVKPSTVSRC
jgi:hypothetical protein